MNNKFRTLRADEIECRVATCKEKGVSLLLYKDARCDMNILDETVGAMNWQRAHTRDNANCIVSIWDAEKSQWISKEDTGAESFSAKEKGLASDSFKRACFNWGIGRELYTSPFIWIRSGDCTIKNIGGRCSTYDKFKVKEIGYDENGKINKLQIMNESKSITVFNMSTKSTKKEYTKSSREQLIAYVKANTLDFKKIGEQYGLSPESDEQKFKEVLEKLKKGE